jgi:DNA polymerase III epsilon subunit-like protein
MFIYLDTETTVTGTEDRLWQLAAFKTDKGLLINELFDLGLPVKIEAMAVHRITNKMLAGKPAFKGSSAYNRLGELIEDEANIIVGHNARFDISMLERVGIHPPHYICTLKLACYLDPKGIIPRYNLQCLRYYLDLEIEAIAHDALGDILVLEALFKRLHAKFESFEIKEIPAQIIQISQAPILISRMPFGKHEGLHFSEVPKDYLAWLATTDIDDDLAYAVTHYLNK